MMTSYTDKIEMDILETLPDKFVEQFLPVEDLNCLIVISHSYKDVAKYEGIKQ